MILQVEYHITDRCNLSCKFCSHYSDMHISDREESIEATVREWSAWSKRISPVYFYLLGGEPLLNKNLEYFIIAAKRIWTKSIICLVSNGVLIDKTPNIENILIDCKLDISIHNERSASAIVSKVESVPFTNTTIAFRESYSSWKNYYQIVDNRPAPFNDGNKRKSWEICNSKKCIVLRDNRLWKCPQVALAASVNIDWFKDYKSLEIEASDEELNKWLLREDEDCCSNCPAT